MHDDFDRASWIPCGETRSASHFSMGDHVLIVWPRAGAVDTAETAAENRDFQHAYFRERGVRGAVAIFFDRLSGQDREARRVTTTGIDPELTGCIAVVGDTLLTKVMSSFVTGVGQTSTPIRRFPTIAEALPWIDRQLGRGR